MELRHQYDLEVLLNLTNIARSSFYYHQKQISLPDKYQVTKELIKAIYHKHKGRYGYRRITDEIKNKGFIINHKTVLRLIICELCQELFSKFNFQLLDK